MLKKKVLTKIVTVDLSDGDVRAAEGLSDFLRPPKSLVTIRGSVTMILTNKQTKKTRKSKYMDSPKTEDCWQREPAKQIL